MDDKNNAQNPSTDDTALRELNNDSTSGLNQRPEYNQAARFNQPQPEAPEYTSVNQDVAPAPVTAPPKKSKKKLIVALIIVALLLLSLGLAYVYWYQNPNKVVSDAFVHALNSKTVTYTGTLTSAGSSKMVITMNGGATVDGGTINAKLAYEVDGKKYTLDGNGIIDKKNDVYFKVQNIDSLVNNYRRSIPAESQSLFDQVIDKVDNKWVKISSDDIKSLSPEFVKTRECLADSMSEMRDDDAVRGQLIDTYKKHPFITIDKSLGAKNGSLGYSLKTNAEAEKAFGKEFKNTTFYKSLVKCDSSLAEEEDNQLEQYTGTLDEDVATELWVDRWNHQITKFTIKQDEDGQTTNAVIEPKFNRPVAIVTPKDSTTISQLQQDIQALLQSASAQDTTRQSDSMMES